MSCWLLSFQQPLYYPHFTDEATKPQGGSTRTLTLFWMLWGQILKSHAKEFGGGIWQVGRDFPFLFIFLLRPDGSFHYKLEQTKK